MRSHGGAVPLALLAGSLACGKAPAEPSHYSRDRTIVLRAPVCKPVGVEIHCTDKMWTADAGELDVTDVVTWLPSDSWSDYRQTSSVAIVRAPGIIAPTRPGIVTIHVFSSLPGPSGASSSSPHSYAVDPAAPAIPLAPNLSGFVSEADGQTPISDALVEIVDGGVDTGKTDRTRGNGVYFINYVRMGVPLTARASKPGYVAAVGTNPGIVDDALGYPEAAYLHFRLARAPVEPR